MSPDPIESLIVQTRLPPLQQLSEVQDHVAALLKLIEWEEVGILYDDAPSAILVLFLNTNSVKSAIRFCLNTDESVAAIQSAQQGAKPVLLACWQDKTLTVTDIVSLETLSDIWARVRDQSIPVDEQKTREFFTRVEISTREKGRGQTFSQQTRVQVWFDAHGRCMFEGCGIDLTIDPITGQKGNFAYLSHNVAASETGPRGILYLSAQLSDEPNNILLLCDSHHRLIDTVAKADYPAECLSKMRRRFCDDAGDLLDGLAKPPIPVYCVSWPVHRQMISAPSVLQIAQSLVPIGARMDGRLNHLSDNEATLRETDPAKVWLMMPDVIESTAARLLMQVHDKFYRAALFAIGLMPPLIALGAKIGNKCEITPMLRDRENGLWYWPASQPRGQFYSIDGLNDLSNNESDVVICLSLTANPQPMLTTIKNLGFKAITICAHTEFMGNGALAHPLDGNAFRLRIQELLHKLKDRHGVRRVHVLPCASNAACVFFGQAFDSYHPDMLIYDFASDGHSMAPRLLVHNKNNQCMVTATEF